MNERKSWFNMAPKRRSSEADQQVIKIGTLTKSPPYYIINKRNSWKRRLFKLYKTMTDAYVISYYDHEGAAETLKGDIYVSDIKCIESGKNIKDKYIQTIERLFNMAPENALYIKTESRNYYLIDSNVENIRDWQRCITEVWMKMNQSVPVPGPRILHTVLSMANHEERPKSLPDDLSRTRTPSDEASDRQRSHTDPETWKESLRKSGDRKELQPWNAPEPLEAVRSVLYSDLTPGWTPRNTETHRLSTASDQDPGSSRSSRSDSMDGAYSSDPDPIYDIPRPTIEKHPSIHLRTNEPQEHIEQHESEDSAELEDSSDTDSSIYEPMSPQNTLAPESNNCPPKPPRNYQAIEMRRTRKCQKSQLNKAYIMKMWYEQDKDSDLEKININVPTDHLQKYLRLQEVGERLFVSKWNGPADIGCVFHHGDCIDAINDFRLGSKDFFDKMLNQSILTEVNIVVLRNKKADVFHVEGCRCDGS